MPVNMMQMSVVGGAPQRESHISADALQAF